MKEKGNEQKGKELVNVFDALPYVAQFLKVIIRTISSLINFIPLMMVIFMRKCATHRESILEREIGRWIEFYLMFNGWESLKIQ